MAVRKLLFTCAVHTVQHACRARAAAATRTYLAHFHVDAPVVLADVEVEVLVVDAQVPPLRQLALEPATHPLL